MDVRCTRCGTEYEFDDALISERGTSVRCTQCGFQFKVFPPHLATVGPDEWIVLTSLGRRVVYRSLRELQTGISKSEVAREDLLARGTKPPRPLGSIAELDPLFAVKAAPERQPSTLTGVAPPAQGAVKSAPPPGGSLGRAGHDTFSGVAPPANSPSGDNALPGYAAEATAQAAARPGAPMRVGGTRTVLGIGSGTEASGTASTGTADTVTVIQKPSAPLDSAPPETRSFESLKPEDAHRALGDEPGGPAIAVTLSSEPPTNPPPPSEQATAPGVQIPEVAAPLPRISTELGMPPAASGAALTSGANKEGNTVPLAVAPPEPPPAKSDVQGKPEAKPVEQAEPPAAERRIAKVQLTTKAVAVSAQTGAAAAAASDPPTVRWTGQTVKESQDSTQSTRQSEPAIVAPAVPPSTSLQPKTARSGEIRTAAPRTPDSKHSEPPRSDSRTRVVPTEELRKLRSDSATAPPARPRSKVPQALEPATAQPNKGLGSTTLGSGSIAPKPLFTTARVTVAVSLIALGLFAGMKIVGSQLQLQPAKVPAKVPSEPVASVQQPVAAAWDTPVVELLKNGDSKGAEQALSVVPANDQGQPRYRTLHAQALAQSADMVWWKVQLIGKAAGEAYAQSKQQLSDRLERLKADLAAVGPEARWPEPIQAASLDARRMRGEKSEPTEPELAERLKHPATSELKYTKLVLAWVRAGLPDAAIIEGLRQLRASPLDLGPRAVALVVALAQLNRFDDAKAELKTLSAQARPHPLYGEMLDYVNKAEQALAETASSAKPDAGTAADNAEPGESDPDLLEGDFRLRLTRASECLSRNELTKAQKLLRSVLAQRPNDTEAITAMGDVMRRRGDLTQSRNLYDKALALNANYLPAMSGAADLRWRTGDRGGAAALYRRILDRVGETPGYGQVAAARLKEIESSAKPAGDSSNPGANSDTSTVRDGKPSAPKADAPSRTDKPTPKGAP